jgi:hypothetical protein
MGLFKTPNTIGATLSKIIVLLLAKLQLINKVITYVKDESFNLNTLASTLFSIVKYVPSQLVKPFVNF